MSSTASKRVTRSTSKASSTQQEAVTSDMPSADSSHSTAIDLTSSSEDSHSSISASEPAAGQSNKRKRSYFDQTPRRVTHARLQSQPRNPNSRKFDYSLDYASLDLRDQPELYRVGVSEQGVLLVQPYKSEILPHWRFKNPQAASDSSAAIEALFRAYQQAGDFVGCDMARKFLQMGYTRSRRYANHKDGRKYDEAGHVRELEVDEVKAASAEIFRTVWKRVEADEQYMKQKAEWKKKYG